MVYTAADDPSDAKVVARIGPDVTEIVSIDLGVSVPSDKQINFSLTDGDNLPFQIKKTGDDTAMIVKREGATLTSAQPYNFQLVVNEFENAPANTQDVDVVVNVVIDNEPPTFTDAPASGTVLERATDATIATFSASDINNQVLRFDIEPGDAGVTSVLSSLTIGRYTGVLKTDDSDDDQPDYIEDNPGTTDVDESEDANEHVFMITVTDGTSTVEHEFTLTVIDVDDPRSWFEAEADDQRG